MSHQSFFKQPVSPKVLRSKRSLKQKLAEGKVMSAVRREDRYCRFPLCGCRKHHLSLAVCHQRHRGMGGNPGLDRTTPEGLILLCSARHRENRIAWDRSTLAIRPLNPALGLRGPCAWFIDTAELPDLTPCEKWLEVAREIIPHHFEPSTAAQLRLLEILKEMEL